MQLVLRFAATGLVLLFATACATTKVTDRESRIEGRQIPRPERILVHDFGVTTDEVHEDSALAGQEAAPAMSPEDLAEARALGRAVADRLAEKIRDMGMPAEHVASNAPLRLDDIVIRGHFVTIDEGNRAERMLIGFGAGGSKLSTVVEGYQVTPQGIRRLGRGTVEAGGARGPGAAVPAAVAIATANPIGLVVTSAFKVAGEASGRSTVEGRAEQTADEIADCFLRGHFLPFFTSLSSTSKMSTELAGIPGRP